jgi:hypothetical protein
MDYELWGKFLLAGAEFHYTGIPFGIFRLHAQQKTGQAWAATQALVETAESLVGLATHLTDTERRAIVAELHAYKRDYWRDTGPLARLGLPPNMVLPLRDMQATLRRRAVDFVRRAS